MKSLRIYQVDAFSDHVFGGNPAAVVPLYDWLDDSTLLNIASENNLSETAFFIIGSDTIQLRWFTPADEVDLCGHATLAAAHVIFTELNYPDNAIRFDTKSGVLEVTKANNGYQMDFPATLPEQCQVPADLVAGLNNHYVSITCGYDYLIELENEQAVIECSPDLSLWKKIDKRGVIITASSNEYDVVSRCFYPKLLVDEDPVTGSAHCQIAPYWFKKLGLTKITAFQASKRGGVVECKAKDNRVILNGKAVTYLKGEIFL